MQIDSLKYLTVLIETETPEGTIAGTGFFYGFSIDGKYVPAIVTANHVVSKGKVTLNLRYKVGEHIAQIRFPCNAKWFCSKSDDLACCLVFDIEQEFLKIVGYPIFYRVITEDGTITRNELENIKILSEVIMVGYPSGTGSTVFSYPIFQKGWIASPPEYSYDKKYVDITTIPGSSGSPLILAENKVKLLGIMSQAVVENPFSCADLGVYTDAYHLFEIKEMLKER